jgi:outer membrane murein-binding lipoprotein Lpp
MIRAFVIVAFLVAVACTAGGSGTCQNPVHDACSAKASDVSSELAKIAAEQQKTPAEMTTEFVNACEGQLESDLDQTLANLQAIANAKDGSP